MERCPECDSIMIDEYRRSICPRCDTVVSGTIGFNYTSADAEFITLPWEDEPEEPNDRQGNRSGR